MKTKSRVFLRASLFVLIYAGFIGCAATHSGLSTDPGLKIYFVRHAETIANATGQKDEISGRTFTEAGQQQIQDLTEQLSHLKIDQVLVSPVERTRLTILPYLKMTIKSAEIWPELEEWIMESQVKMGLEPMDGPEIQIEKENQDYFHFRDKNATRRYYTKDYEGGLEQVQKVADFIRKRFGNTDQTILIVGHKDSGARILESLLGFNLEARFKLDHGKLSEIRQMSSGRFELILLNGEVTDSSK